MNIFAIIGNAIWAKLDPHIVAMRKDVKTELDEWQVIAQKELDEWQATATAELAAWRVDTIKMLSEALPEMAGKVAEQAVLTTFEHTQVDEAADAVSGLITDIVGRVRFPFLGVDR